MRVKTNEASVLMGEEGELFVMLCSTITNSYIVGGGVERLLSLSSVQRKRKVYKKGELCLFILSSIYLSGSKMLSSPKREEEGEGGIRL